VETTRPTPPHIAALLDVPLDRRPLLLDLIAAHFITHEGMRRETFTQLAATVVAR
jgi:hypothetical protein